MYQCPWCGVFGPNFLDLPQFPKYTKTGITQPSDGLYPWVRLHLMWNVEFNFWMTFCVSLSLIWGNWATFCQLAPVPQIHEKSINWPSDDLLHLSRALLGFIWCEMKSLTLWMIFFVLLLWRGIWAQSPQCAAICQTYQNRYNLTCRWPLHLSKASFDVKYRI